MIGKTIISTIFLIILGTTIIFLDKKKIIIFLCILSVLGYILCINDIHSDIPAIEVYRGNTELQITYKGDTPIDSIVVRKNK